MFASCKKCAHLNYAGAYVWSRGRGKNVARAQPSASVTRSTDRGSLGEIGRYDSGTSRARVDNQLASLASYSDRILMARDHWLASWRQVCSSLYGDEEIANFRS